MRIQFIISGGSIAIGRKMRKREIWYVYLKTNTDLYFNTGLPSIFPPVFFEKDENYQSSWRLYQNVTDAITYTITMANFIGTIMLDEVFPILSSIPPLVHGIQISGRTIILKVSAQFHGRRYFPSMISKMAILPAITMFVKLLANTKSRKMAKLKD